MSFRRDILLIIGLVAGIAGAIITAFDIYLAQMSRELLRAWLASEAIAIDEGNLLTSIGKSDRILRSSNFTKGVALIDVGAGRLERAVLAQFGVVALDSFELPAESDVIETRRLGPFHHQVLYRFPSRPQVVAVFDVKPRFIYQLAAGSVGALLVLGLAFTWVMRRLLQREASRRLATIRTALSELTSNDRPSEVLIAECPQLVHAWGAMVEETKRSREDLQRSSAAEAIVKTAQMLAHDIRKPFATIRLGLDAIASASGDGKKVTSLVGELRSETEKTLETVMSMVSDLNDLGSDLAPALEPAEIEALVRDALRHVFCEQPARDITISYRFDHTYAANVEYGRILRGLLNIVENASDAVPSDGTIWFRTRDVHTNGGVWIELGVGNSGSYVPSELRSRVFEPFVSHGKPGGTGLGLAIAEKVVRDHSGQIWCESTVESGTEIWRRLLSNGKRRASAVELPVRASDFQTDRSSAVACDRIAWAPDPGPQSERSRSFGARGARIVVIEDDVGYASALADMIRRSVSHIQPGTDVRIARGSIDLLPMLTEWSLDVAIVDFDLGARSDDGVALIRRLRTMFPAAILCFHSNRCLAKDVEAAMLAGADIVLPKPMRQEDLYRLFDRAGALTDTSTILADPERGERPEIAVVHPSVFVRNAWKDGLRRHFQVRAFTSGAELNLSSREYPESTRRLLCIAACATETEAIGSLKGVPLFVFGDTRLGDCQQDDVAARRWSIDVPAPDFIAAEVERTNALRSGAVSADV